MGGAQGVVGRWAWLLAVAAVVTGAGQALELPVGQEWAVRTSLDLPLGRRQPQAPLFPRSFEVVYNFSLPYEASVQADGLTYPVHVWKDHHTSSMRMDTYGWNSLVTVQDAQYEVVPRIDKLICRQYAAAEGEDLLNEPILPDVSGWAYGGVEKVRGIAANLWVFEQSHAGGQKVTRYEFYAAVDDGRPLRLHQIGNDLFSGSHFDEYNAEFLAYRPGRPAAEVFAKPALCSSTAAERVEGQCRAALRLVRLLPSVRPGESSSNLEGSEAADAVEYDQFALAHGRTNMSAEQRIHRLGVWRENRNLVDAWNAQPNRSYVMGYNRFLDWTQEEYEALMLPRRGKQGSRGPLALRNGPGRLPYERRLPHGRLPRSVDWRGTGADGIVKDQAACGSCWAFSTTGALQSAAWMATGREVRLSEQQLMDCSWNFENAACDGGEQDAAIDYMVGAGGIAGEAEYEYMGQDGFCRTGNVTSSLLRFQGYALVPQYDDEAAMEALVTRGPLAISLDASQESFRFYAKGVYDEPKCLWKEYDLDHAVLLVGYGTTDSGQDYWIVKNSWSQYWGDAGYIHIARGHGCGVTTVPMYVVPEAVPEQSA